MSTRDIYQTAFDEDVSTTSSATETCPECDGRVQTNARETACEDCGLVIIAQELDRGPQQYTDDEESTPRTGAPRTVARHDRGLSTKIGTDRDGKGQTLSTGKRRQLRRLRREHRRGNAGSKRERNERYGLMEIRRLASALEVPESIRDRACSLFQTAQDENLLKGRSIATTSTGDSIGTPTPTLPRLTFIRRPRPRRLPLNRPVST